MLLLSGTLHLLLLVGWAVPVAAPAGMGKIEMTVSLRSVPAPQASRPADAVAADNEQAPGVAGSGSEPVAAPASDPAPTAANDRVEQEPRKASEQQPAPDPVPQLADNPAPETRSEPSPPAEPAPARPEPAPEPNPAPRYEPGLEPEVEDPFEELLSDQQEVVASAQAVSAPVASEPQWRRQPQPPVYPALARRRGQEGEVMLRLDIDARGEVTEARVLTSSGFPLLDRAAREAGLGWELVPARIDGIAVASYVTIPVQFRLQ